jgi:hypothetical protein
MQQHYMKPIITADARENRVSSFSRCSRQATLDAARVVGADAVMVTYIEGTVMMAIGTVLGPNRLPRPLPLVTYRRRPTFTVGRRR